MNLHRWAIALALPILTVSLNIGADDKKTEPVRPKEVIKLFNGKDLTGFTTWLKETKRDDPTKVFSVQDGMIRSAGKPMGYLATDKEYQDYRLTLEWKWGKETYGARGVRNSGILVNAVGPDGGAGGLWMSCIECQVAQGGVGDFIAIRGKDDKGEVIPVQFTSETAVGEDKHPRWKKGGEPRTFTKGQQWWSLHQNFFKEDLDARGKQDVESPLGEWTKMEIIADGKRLTVKVNGTIVNEAFDVYPPAGKILLQSEGFEIFFRNVELHPLK